MTLYPMGYGTQLVTMALLRARHEPRMHPEFARRLFAYLESKNGSVGIGGGWRATGAQPDKPGFAPEGKSFHQNQQFASGHVGYAAVDLVAVDPSKVHRSPTWAECADGPLWGVHTFIDGEPWHIQPYEMRGWNRWVADGRRDPIAGFQLPGHPTHPELPEISPPIGDIMGLTFAPVSNPDRARVLDTRKPATPAAGGNAGHRLGQAPDKPWQITVHAHRAEPPEGARAAAVNVAAVEVAGPGFLTAWTAGHRPETSVVNYTIGGDTRNGFTIVPLSGFGTFELAAAVSAAHATVDVAGWFIDEGAP